MPFICRPARISDQDSIAFLSKQWGYHNSHEKISQGLHEILKHADHQVIILEHEQVISGWIHGIYSFPHCC